MRQRLEKYPDDFTANFNMGDLLMNKRDPQGALPYFEAAVRANPVSAVAQTELGVALFQAGKLPEAEEQFKRALRMEPGYTDARYDLASVQAARQEWDDAVASFQAVLAERPDDAKSRQHLGDALYLWGDALAQAGRSEDALARYRAAAEVVPATAELHTKMALMLARMARLPEAQTELESALKVDAHFAPAQRMLADVKKRLEGK